MNDQGFHFQSEPPRREARKFEPPPWEKDLYDQSAPRQSDQEAPSVQAPSEHEADRAPAAESPQGPKGAPAAEPLDEQTVARMLIELRAEEPVGLEGAWVVNAAAGFVLVLVGVMAAIWSATALAKPGMSTVGFMVAFSLMALGLGFMGVGVWLLVKALRQQGVL